MYPESVACFVPFIFVDVTEEKHTRLFLRAGWVIVTPGPIESKNPTFLWSLQ